MTKQNTCLIGRDVKPAKKVVIRRNRFKTTYHRWLLFPAIIALVTLVIFVVAGSR